MCTSNRSDASVISINIVLTALIKPRIPQTWSAWTCPTGWHWPLVASPGAAGVDFYFQRSMFSVQCLFIYKRRLGWYFLCWQQSWTFQVKLSSGAAAGISSNVPMFQCSNVLTVNAFFTSWKDRIKLFLHPIAGMWKRLVHIYLSWDFQFLLFGVNKKTQTDIKRHVWVFN